MERAETADILPRHDTTSAPASSAPASSPPAASSPPLLGLPGSFEPAELSAGSPSSPATANPPPPPPAPPAPLAPPPSGARAPRPRRTFRSSQEQ